MVSYGTTTWAVEVVGMKKYVVELDDDLSNIYEDIAKLNNMPTGKALQIILKRVIETMLKESPTE